MKSLNPMDGDGAKLPISYSLGRTSIVRPVRIKTPRDTFGPGIPGGRTGKVAVYDFEAGLGVVEDSAGQRWMFHCTAIAGGSRTIDGGTRVSFEVRPGGPGRFEAFDVLALG